MQRLPDNDKGIPSGITAWDLLQEKCYFCFTAMHYTNLLILNAYLPDSRILAGCSSKME